MILRKIIHNNLKYFQKHIFKFQNILQNTELVAQRGFPPYPPPPSPLTDMSAFFFTPSLRYLAPGGRKTALGGLRKGRDLLNLVVGSGGEN